MRILTRTQRYALRAAVRARLDALGISNEEAARRIGGTVSQVAHAAIPTGTQTGALLRLARAYDVAVAE